LGFYVRRIAAQQDLNSPMLTVVRNGFRLSAYLFALNAVHNPYAEEERDWLQDYIEGWRNKVTIEDKREALNRLSRCDLMGKYISEKFPSTKVFGIEGCEVLIPGLAAMLRTASRGGVEVVELGMSHRGRLNVLHDFFQKPLHSIINQFRETEPTHLGDKNYHLGARTELEIVGSDGITRNVRLSLEANPSHLEHVNAVVIGKVRAKQYFGKDTTRKKILPLLLHGDAAFSGQGIVSEVMEVSVCYIALLFVAHGLISICHF
jgi:2-oxoglutarate dehydrogenase E1 component